MGRRNKKPTKKWRQKNTNEHSRQANVPQKPSLRERLPWLSSLPDALIILAYIVVVTFTPAYMGLDNNASKFLALALLNLLSFVLLLVRKEYWNHPALFTGMFRTGPGLAFAGFLFFSLLSFTQAINIEESVLHFAKLFSVFSAALIFSVILMRDLRYIQLVVVAMVLLLLFDAVTVFLNIRQVVEGDIALITEIKGVYSNKNILASALFVKIPFALYLLFFDKHWMRALGGTALVAGVIAVFFMAARAFYLGLFGYSMVFLVYQIVRYVKKRKIKHLAYAGSVVGAMVLAVWLFSVFQRQYFSEMRFRQFQGIVTQLLTFEDGGVGQRAAFYRWTADMIRKNPVLGVGSGNWKINILKYENQEKPGFIYSYKAHNDFLEAMAETGIPGGLLFLSIFILAARNFWRYHKKTDGESDPMYAALFLAAAGLAFYAVDAMFNFPADRPEILVLFALFLAIGVAASQKHRVSTKEETRLSSRVLRMLVVLALVLMAGSGWALHQNFRSAQLQAVVYSDISSGSYRAPMRMIVGRFPSIPNISLWVESVSALQARYLIEAGRYRAAIDLLKDDHKNPYDSRREYYMAMAYDHLGNTDSALVYAKKAYELKPRHPGNALLYARSLMLTGAFEEATEVVETAQGHRPLPSRQNQQALQQQLQQIEQQRLFNQAIARYDAAEYEATLNALDEFILLVPDNANAYNYRAYTNYHLGRYDESIKDINRCFELIGENASLLNLRGVCLWELGEGEAACRDFMAAIAMGSESAQVNYARYCE